MEEVEEMEEMKWMEGMEGVADPASICFQIQHQLWLDMSVQIF